MTLSIPQSKQPLVLTGVMIALVISVWGIQVSRLNKLRSTNNLDPASLRQETDIKAIKLEIAKKSPKFGFRNMIANATFIDFMQYFGNQKVRNVDGYGLSFDYFDVILQKDPKFFLAYYYLSGAGTGYLADPSRAIQIMNEGFKSITPQAPTTSYYLWRLKSTSELLFMGDVPAAKASMEKAVEWANQIGDEEGKRVAEISQESVTFLAKNPDSKKARFAAWTSVLDTAIDDSARRIAVAKIQELGGKIELDPQGKLKITPPATD